MANSSIEWTEKTWNPTTGCNKVSAGCKNCYAEVMHRRMMKMMPSKYSRPFLDGAFAYPPELKTPMKWKTPSRIFVNSMSDLFHPNIPFEYIKQVYNSMMEADWHTYQILTKRPDRALEFYSWLKKQYVETRLWDKVKWPLPNVWLLVSCEDQETANERIPLLLQIPAAVRGISAEPLLGPIDLLQIKTINDNKLDWVITGGESGHDARPPHPDWIRSLRDQCKKFGVAFFFKQWGEYGKDCAEYPMNTKAVCVDIKGRFVKYPVTGDLDILKIGITMYKNGKKKSGCLLDGIEHKEYPKLQTA